MQYLKKKGTLFVESAINMSALHQSNSDFRANTILHNYLRQLKYIYDDLMAVFETKDDSWNG